MKAFTCPTCGTTLATVEAVSGEAVFCEVCRADVAVPASTAGFSSPTTPARSSHPQWSDWPDDEDVRSKPRSIVNTPWNPWQMLLGLSPLLFIGFCVVGYNLLHYEVPEKECADLAQTKLLTAACETYKVNHGDWPPNLDALTDKSPSSGMAIVEKDMLFAKTKTWEQYQYDPTGPRNGGTKPDIWVDTPRGPIGNWTTRPPR